MGHGAAQSSSRSGASDSRHQQQNHSFVPWVLRDSVANPVRLRRKMARWWDRLGGRPVSHAASPRFVNATQIKAALEIPELEKSYVSNDCRLPNNMKENIRPG